MGDVAELKNKRTRGSASLDSHVGERLRQRRCGLGLSIETVAHFLHVPGSRLIEYERGTASMEPHRLALAACVLDASIAWFFEFGSSESVLPKYSDI